MPSEHLAKGSFAGTDIACNGNVLDNGFVRGQPSSCHCHKFVRREDIVSLH
jgi:hypothetical protein